MVATDTPPHTLHPRLEFDQVFPEAGKALIHLERVTREGGLEPALYELVKIRASQINGCAFCLDMHTKDARAAGEDEQRIYTLNAWAETPFFTMRERAALALTEAVTLVSTSHVPDDVYAEAAKYFDDRELAALVMAITMINVWNRLAITTRQVSGTYQVGAYSSH